MARLEDVIGALREVREARDVVELARAKEDSAMAALVKALPVGDGTLIDPIADAERLIVAGALSGVLGT